MISYTTIGTNNFDKAVSFYDELLSVINIGKLWSDERFVGYGTSMDQPMFSVCKPHDGAPATAGNGTMIALSCPDADAVDAIYTKALNLGATDAGPSGRRGDSGFYIGYFHDLDGNKIAAFAMIKPVA